MPYCRGPLREMTEEARVHARRDGHASAFCVRQQMAQPAKRISHIDNQYYAAPIGATRSSMIHFNTLILLNIFSQCAPAESTVALNVERKACLQKILEHINLNMEISEILLI